MNKQFGKYRLLDKIATGGMAEIWLARQTGVKGFEKLVVIKKILPEFTRNKEFVDMFLDEARVAAMLTHSNIVQIYDLGNINSIYFIAMEYIFGLSLDHLLIQSVKRKNPLPFQFSCHIISQSATGLHYAHTMKDIYGVSMHIVHRDISPQNILVSFEGIAKVVDFGIAKAKTTTKEATQAGKIKGKVSYMSPEQIRGEHLDGRSDVFALAIVLYEITTGKRLFPSITNPFEVMDLMLNRDFIPPHVLNPKYPKILSKIIMKGLAKDKNLRYKTALSFSNDLDRFLKSFKTPVYSNDLAIWLKKTFQDIIVSTRSKHEDLLWEDDDSVGEESTLSALKKIPSLKKSPPKYEEEEATVFGKPDIPSLKKETVDYGDDDATLFGKPDFDLSKYKPKENPVNNSEEEKTMVFAPKPIKNPKPIKKPLNNDFDFPNDDDFDFPDDEFKEKKKKKKTRRTNKKNTNKITPQKTDKKARKSLSYSNKRVSNKSSKKEDIYEEDSDIKLKKKKKEKSFISWLVGKIILLVILYTIYFIGINAWKYLETEESLSNIMRNAMRQSDISLSINKSVEFFCKNNENVKCIKDSYKITDNNNEIGFSISYKIEGNILGEIMQFLPKEYQRTWPIKIKFNYENKINLR